MTVLYYGDYVPVNNDHLADNGHSAESDHPADDFIDLTSITLPSKIRKR